MKTICTIASSNYLAHVRTLMQSVAQYEPDVKRVVCIVDEPRYFNPDSEPFQVVYAKQLGIPNWRHFAFKYSILELNTAVKPYLLQDVLEYMIEDAESVVYLDPDICLYQPLTAVWDALQEHSIVLTPHLRQPLPPDGKRQTEVDMLGAGTFNLGFIAVNRGALAMLHWWQERLYTGCQIRADMSLFVDQKWCNLLPGLFDGVYIWRDIGANLAYWNFQEWAEETPIIFIHFSGYKPDKPDVVSEHQNRFTMQDLPAQLQWAFQEYHTALRHNGYDTVRHWPYTYSTFECGVVITDTMRRHLLTIDPLGQRYPEPFRQAYLDHLQAPADQRGLISQYAALLPERQRHDDSAYAEWLAVHQPRWVAKRSDVNGLNLIGFGSEPTGVGQVMRGMAQACQAAGMPFSVTNLTNGSDATLHRYPQGVVYRTNLFCVNADMTAWTQGRLPAWVYEGYNIADWHWELDTLPEHWQEHIAVYDAFWVSSTFIADMLRKVTDKPVHVVPPVINPLGYPVKNNNGLFKVLYMFDMHSVMERKNPLAAIAAFRQAALPESLLLIKASNLEAYPEQAQQLHAAAGDGVAIYSEQLPREAVWGLYANYDCYLSTHRSEGFGLTIAEAMSYGLPTIATAYGGNMDFMTEHNSYPVPFRKATLERDYPPYPQGATWADIDIRETAKRLKAVRAQWLAGEPDPRGLQAAQDIREQYSAAAVGQRIADLLKDVHHA